MGLSILNNIPSLVAQNQLAMTNTNLQNTLFQLSSGSKINSGADDPAGLSIADGLQANISALTQSAQNVTDGVGLLQTARWRLEPGDDVAQPRRDPGDGSSQLRFDARTRQPASGSTE